MIIVTALGSYIHIYRKIIPQSRLQEKFFFVIILVEISCISAIIMVKYLPYAHHKKMHRPEGIIYVYTFDYGWPGQKGTS